MRKGLLGLESHLRRRRRPHTSGSVSRPEALLDGYRRMAADRRHEAEAEEWVEALVEDVGCY